MTWAAARSALVAALEGVAEIDQVLLTPPAAGAALRSGVTAMLIPPGRTSDRRAGQATAKSYQQDLTVASPVGNDPQTAALLVDDAVEAIDEQMERHATLGGTVTRCGPFAWEAAVASQVPGSGVWYVSMTGTATLDRIYNVVRSA